MPGFITAGSASLALSSHLDLLPTFCSLAQDCVLPAAVPLDGFDISPVLFAAPKDIIDGHDGFGGLPPSPREAFFFYAAGGERLKAADDKLHVASARSELQAGCRPRARGH